MSAAPYFSAALTANGGVTGQLQVSSTATLLAGAHVVIDSRTQSPLELKIFSIDSGTLFTCKTLADAVVDLSTYLVAENARVTQYAQRDVNLFLAGTYVLKSGDVMTGQLTVGALIQSTVGGFKFPDNTIQTTAAAGSGALPITTISSNTTLTGSHYMVLVNAAGGPVTVTLPAAALNTGRLYVIKKTDLSSNLVTIDGNGSELIDGALTQILGTANEVIGLHCTGSSWAVW